MACGIQLASTPEGTGSLSLWIMMQFPRPRTPPACRFILETATTLEVNSPALENKGGRANAMNNYFTLMIFFCQLDHSHLHTPAHTHTGTHSQVQNNEKQTLWQLCKYKLSRSVQRGKKRRKRKKKNFSYKSRCYITCPKEIFVAMPSSVITLGRRKSAENLENMYQQSAVREKGKIQVGKHNPHAQLSGLFLCCFTVWIPYLFLPSQHPCRPCPWSGALNMGKV